MRQLTKKSLDELAKVMPVVSEAAQRTYIGGGNGTANDPYTVEEYDRMGISGTWNGGYVEGMGYVADDVYIYGSSTYPGSTSQNYYTFPDYIASLSSSGIEQIAEVIVDRIFASITAYWGKELGDMTRDIQSDLLKKGYDGSSAFNIVRTSMNNSVLFSVYDANTGQFITSKNFYTTGFWK